MVYTIGTGTCDGCGVEDKCLTIAADAGSAPVTLCGKDIAQLMEELTGHGYLNLYRVTQAQSQLKIRNPIGLEDIPLGKRRRK
jgi:hypothetical protein